MKIAVRTLLAAAALTTIVRLPAQEAKRTLSLDEVLGHSDYSDVQRMGGLTNRTYCVTFADGSRIMVRIPGEGTEELIDRADEKVSTELACRLGIDAKLYFCLLYTSPSPRDTR